MAEAFNLYGTLGLNTVKFKSNLKSAEKNLGSFKAKYKKTLKGFKRQFKQAERSLNEFANSVKGPALALAGLAAGFTAAQKAAMNSAQEFGQMASTLGITVERAQALTAAFEAQGLEANDVSDAMNTIVDRAKDAQDGMQSFIDDFGLIGVGVDDLKNKNPDQLFDTFANAIKNTNDPVARQAALVRILGDDLGRRLGPALLNGAQGFRDLQSEMEKTGVLMSQEMIDKAERANRSFNLLVSVIKTGLTKAMVVFAPIVEAVTEKMRDSIRVGGGFETKVKGAIVAAARAIGVFADGVHGLRIIFKAAEIAGTGFSLALLNGFKTILDAIGAVGSSLRNVFVDGLLKVTEALAPFNDSMNSLADSLRSISDIDIGAPEFLNDAVVANAERLGEAISEIQDILNKDLPSETITRKIQEVLDPVKLQGAGQGADPTESGEAGAEGGKEFSLAFVREMNQGIRGSVSAALEGDFKSIGDMWKDLLKRMVADAIAADLSSAFGLGGQDAGGFAGGKDFLSTIGGIFGGFAGGGGGSTSSTIVNNSVNIATQNAASFTPSRARMMAELERSMTA